MNYYEHWLGDYAKKTSRLRLAEHGAYRLLLDEYYANEKPLPPDYEDLYHVCRAVSKLEQESVRKVAERFFPIGSDGLRHNYRADEEIAKAMPRIEASRANGKGGGRPKKNPTGNPPGTRQEPNSYPTGNPTGYPPETRAGEAFPHTPIPTPRKDRAGVVAMSAAGERKPPPEQPLPGNLHAETWAQWRSHLAAKGKGMTPQQERLQLVRLAEHPDAERSVKDAIAAGHATLPPAGGWPSQRDVPRETGSQRGRQRVADAIFGAGDERRDETDITGEAQRLS